MANTKISQLPSFSGDPSGSILVVNNSGSTETFQIRREAFIDTGVAGFSWTTNYANLTNNVENFPRWDTTVLNSNSNIFGLISASAAGSQSRVEIKETGFYEITSQVHLFDLFNNMDLTVRLQSASSVQGAMSGVTLLNDSKFSELTADQLINGTMCFRVTTAPAYYTISINPSANSPFPSNTGDAPTRIFIKKLAN